MNITTDLVSFLAKRDYNLDDLIIVYCIENEEKELLNSYIADRNSNQALALFQRFERKLIIERTSDEFNIDNYVITELGATLLLECMSFINDIDVIISESIGNITRENMNNSDLEELVKNFLDIFPKNTRNKAGETLRSNEIDTLNKMKKFLKKYKKYNSETILKATTNYIQQQSVNNYSYCSAAHYFIDKLGHGSKLANECNNVLSGADSIGSYSDQLA